MQGSRWGNSNLGNSSTVKVKEQGCFLTGFSMVVSTLIGKGNLYSRNAFTPNSINSFKSFFEKNSQSMLSSIVGNSYNLKFDWWTKSKQGDLSVKLSEIADSSKKFSVLGYVACNKDKPNNANHWVYINSSPMDGSQLGDEFDDCKYVEMLGTSENDKPSNRPSGWIEKNGKMYIPTKMIDKIYTWNEENKNE